MPPPRRRSRPFQPRFTLSLFYLFGFFFLYCFVLIAPTLLEVLQTVPAGPEQERAAEAAAREAVRPRLLLALAAALATVAAGSWFEKLPGLRAPR